MKRVEDIIDFRGRLRKPINKVSRRQKGKLAWRKAEKKQLWDEARQFGGWPICGLCGFHIYDPSWSELDHKIPVRRGGDVRENVHLVHTLGNRAKGSMDFEDYTKLPYEVRVRNCGFERRGQ